VSVCLQHGQAPCLSVGCQCFVVHFDEGHRSFFPSRTKAAGEVLAKQKQHEACVFAVSLLPNPCLDRGAGSSCSGLPGAANARGGEGDGDGIRSVICVGASQLKTSTLVKY